MLVNLIGIVRVRLSFAKTWERQPSLTVRVGRRAAGYAPSYDLITTLDRCSVSGQKFITHATRTLNYWSCTVIRKRNWWHILAVPGHMQFYCFASSIKANWNYCIVRRKYNMVVSRKRFLRNCVASNVLMYGWRLIT